MKAETESHGMQQRLQKCRSTIHNWWKRCIGESPLYMLSVILQPQYRTELFSAWGSVYGEESVAQAQERATAFWQQYKQAESIQPPAPPAPPSQKKKKTNSTEMSALTSKLHALTIAPPRPRDELTDYLLSNLNSDIQKLGLQGYSNSSLIEWWYKQRHQWPTLSRFAIEILSIAAMSDDVERVFSGCRRTISWERARLGLDKVEAVECLGSWFPLNAEDEVGGLGDDSEDTSIDSDSEGDEMDS